MIWPLSPLDVVALLFFAVAWLGYAPAVRRLTGHAKVAFAMADHRQAWMSAMLGRTIRDVDTMIVANIMSTAAFFASTAVVVVGALLGVLVSIESKYVANASGASSLSVARNLIELKLILMVIVALYAFMSFTWSIRQANYVNVLIGASPQAPVEPELRRRIASNMANMITQVAGSYDAGMRAYYFGLGAVSWIIGPGLFLATTAGLVVLLLNRQMSSVTALALGNIAALEAGTPRTEATADSAQEPTAGAEGFEMAPEVGLEPTTR